MRGLRHRFDEARPHHDQRDRHRGREGTAGHPADHDIGEDQEYRLDDERERDQTEHRGEYRPASGLPLSLQRRVEGAVAGADRPERPQHRLRLREFHDPGIGFGRGLVHPRVRTLISPIGESIDRVENRRGDQHRQRDTPVDEQHAHRNTHRHHDARDHLRGEIGHRALDLTDVLHHEPRQRRAIAIVEPAERQAPQPIAEGRLQPARYRYGDPQSQCRLRESEGRHHHNRHQHRQRPQPGLPGISPEQRLEHRDQQQIRRGLGECLRDGHREQLRSQAGVVTGNKGE